MGKAENLSSEIRSRPAFEKLIIGPSMVLGEMLTGGHYLEVLRLGKQLSVGREAAPSYLTLHQTFVSETGFVGAFYRGFLPWGLLQCMKGVPVLFVQNESSYYLQKTGGWSRDSAEKASGFLGGAAQALFVNPFQKIKVTVVACDKMNAMTPWKAARAVVMKHGVLSLYDGVMPMMLRRSLDWGIRFTISNEARNWFVRRKRERGENEALQVYELVICGLVGGAFSALTHPLDNIITNAQKPLPKGESRDVVSVIRRMYTESGYRAFTRAWDIKVLDNAYHMAWMYGIGTFVYDYLRQALADI